MTFEVQYIIIYKMQLKRNLLSFFFIRNIYELLEEEERVGYFDSLRANMIFPKHASKEPGRVTKATMLFPSTIYSHMNAGLANYCAQKTGRPVKDAYRLITYYRSGLMMEELYRLGWTEDDAIRLVAKQHFLQYSQFHNCSLLNFVIRVG
jgi:hypothetical protein